MSKISLNFLFLRSIIICLSFFLILLIFSLSFVLKYYYQSGPNINNNIILIEKGLNLTQITKKLNNEKIIRNPNLFKYILILKKIDKKIKAGEYLIPNESSPQKIINILNHGKLVMRSITVIEGLQIYEILDKIKMHSSLVGDINNSPREGELLPETYFFSWGETRDNLIKIMMKSMIGVLNEEWELKSSNLSIKTKKEAVILASIIEKEAKLKHEKEIISSVFHNRLKLGMRLQSDPTVIYGLNKSRKEKKERLKAEEIKIFTKFNTYMINGLPPEPICNPGIESIRAALNPKDTKYLYFVANGKGGHNFSRNYKGHLKNIKIWKNFMKNKSVK